MAGFADQSSWEPVQTLPAPPTGRWLVLVTIVEARGIAALDYMVKATVSGQDYTYTTRSVRRTDCPEWNEAFTFLVGDLQHAMLGIQLLNWRQTDPAVVVGRLAFPLCEVFNGIMDKWLPLSPGEIHVTVNIQEGCEEVDSDDEQDLAPPGQNDMETMPGSMRSARTETIEAFLRGLKLNPEELRAQARESAWSRYERTTLKEFEETTIRQGPKKRVLPFNRECLKTMRTQREDPEWLTADELRDRIEEIERQIKDIDAEIEDLEQSLA
jgi:hypothetical protein